MSLKAWWSGLPLLLLATACLGTDASDGPPSSLEVVSGSGQTAKVGTTLSTPPAVRVLDDNGHPLPGTIVIFTADAGNGNVTGSQAVADTAGIATVGSWTLGTVIGEQSLLAQVQSLQVQAQITATAIAGSAAGLTALAPAKYAALTSGVVSPSPSVLVTDAFGNPQEGTEVTFTVTLGNGSVAGATAITASNGKASVGSWTLGIAAGVNRLQARIPSGSTVTFDAQGLASPPTVLEVVSAASQNGVLGFQVEKTPRVAVKNAAGALLANVPVTFSLVSNGDATISGASAVSGSDGVAALGDWKLGSVTPSSTVQASIPGFPGPTAQFQATGAAAAFTIDLRLLTSMTANQRDAFVSAAARWMKVVTAGLSGVTVGPDPVTCGTGTPPFTGAVQNMVIFAQVVPIDGVGGILASAGPCVRRVPSYLTVIGSMRMDASDLASLDVSGRLQTVILHEMGHVLGFGTNWTDKGLTSRIGGADPVYTGASALALWPSFSMSYSGEPIPIEDQGGSGTRDAHWRKTVFGSELMTGYIEPAGTPMQMSKLTIAVLKDLGFSVDYNQAESYRGNLWANLGSGVNIPINENVESARFDITSSGKVTPVSQP